MSLKERIKNMLWYLNIIKDCPQCGSKLIESGYPQDFHQFYKCTSENCNFGKPN